LYSTLFVVPSHVAAGRVTRQRKVNSDLTLPHRQSSNSQPNVFWGVRWCGLVDVNRRFREKCCSHYQTEVRLICRYSSHIDFFNRKFNLAVFLNIQRYKTISVKHNYNLSGTRKLNYTLYSQNMYFILCSICGKGSFWCFNFDIIRYEIMLFQRHSWLKYEYIYPSQMCDFLFVFLLMEKSLASTYNFQVMHSSSIFK
jgi:hypothetical protein